MRGSAQGDSNTLVLSSFSSAVKTFDNLLVPTAIFFVYTAERPAQLRAAPHARMMRIPQQAPLNGNHDLQLSTTIHAAECSRRMT